MQDSNVALKHNLPIQLSNITNCPSNWHWTYAAQKNVVADVSYDIWFAVSNCFKVDHERN